MVFIVRTVLFLILFSKLSYEAAYYGRKVMNDYVHIAAAGYYPIISAVSAAQNLEVQRICGRRFVEQKDIGDTDYEDDVDDLPISGEDVFSISNSVGEVRNGSVFSVGLKKNGSTVFCSGTIISQKHIVAAAHCFASLPGYSDFLDSETIVTQFSDEIIYGGTCVGENPKKDPLCPESAKVHLNKIKTVSFRREFRGLSLNTRSDLAIIEVIEPFDFSKEYVKPICLPSYGFSVFDDLTNETEIISHGFGMVTDNHYAHSNYLRKGLFRICHHHFFSENIYEYVSDTSYCIEGDATAMDNKKQYGICQGDSGGDFILDKNRDNAYMMIGVHSAGNDCSNAETNHIPFLSVSEGISNYLTEICTLTGVCPI
uniref:Peptidase S1 domain-containing protein n=1 Tax=Rhabditophanes sp. KR3021 TaxID=114890 RepID=A0AC35TN17_9BILA